MQIKLQPAWKQELYEKRLNLGELRSTQDIEQFITETIATERSKWVDDARREIKQELCTDNSDVTCPGCQVVRDILRKPFLTPPPKGETGSNE